MFVTSLVVACLPQLMTPAHAVPIEPPPSPYDVTIFPQRDLVTVAWSGPGAALTFDLTRVGITIGHAASNQVSPPVVTGGDENAIEVNHDGGLCWQGHTPDILPGDRVVAVGPGAEVAATTQNVTAEPAQSGGGGTVVVRGAALNLNGSAMDLGLVEQRIVSGSGNRFDANGRRDIRATSDGASLGTLVADTSRPGGWIATYSGLSAADVERALAGETRALAGQAVSGGELIGLTIYEAGLTGGPGMPTCPAAAVNSVASSSPLAVNAGNIATGLTLTGASHNASSVTVTLDDANPATPATAAAATTSTAAGSGAYAVHFTGGQLAGLSDGVLTATSSFATTVGTIPGSGRSILKDTVVPQPPTSDTRSGRYRDAQSVRLTLPAGEPASSVVHYTTDASTPGAGSPTAQPIAITSTRRIRGVVIDAAGNASSSVCPAGCFDYVIGGKKAGSRFVVPRKPRILDAERGRRGGPDSAVAHWKAPKDNLAEVVGYRIRALKIRPGKSAKVVKAVRVKATKHQKAMRLPSGNRYRFQVRAFNDAGKSTWSKKSNKVGAR